MNEKIVEMLHLSLEPVGIFLGNASAICELEKGGALYSAECRRAGPYRKSWLRDEEYPLSCGKIWRHDGILG